jgi:hypothetical protein
MTDELTTEEQLRKAIELYEHDSVEWSPDILLNELEFLYSHREKINELITRFKADILEGLNE